MGTMKRIIQALLVLSSWSCAAALRAERHRGDRPRPHGAERQGAMIVPGGDRRALDGAMRGDETAEGMVEVEANMHLKLLVMSSTMGHRAVDVFERSCQSFLGQMLAHHASPVLGIECKVGPKQEQRSLSGSRGLVGSIANARAQGYKTERMLKLQFLFVNVNIKGFLLNDDSVSSDDLTFGDLVHKTFAVNQSSFVAQLKNEGELDGIGEFNDLHTVLAIKLAEGEGMVQGNTALDMTHTHAEDSEIRKMETIFFIVIVSTIGAGLVLCWLKTLCDLLFSSKSAVTKDEVSDAKELTRTDRVILALGGHYV
ncbi:hypothetical protein ACHAWF_013959 [Thalassiosira exigua]